MEGKPVARRSPTMIDIARAAGVSKSTVSLVLRDSPLVKGETRQRVEQAMQRLGYVYNRGAASLRAASSDFVGMVISDQVRHNRPRRVEGPLVHSRQHADRLDGGPS